MNHKTSDSGADLPSVLRFTEAGAESPGDSPSGSARTTDTVIQFIAYGPEAIVQQELKSLDELPALLGKHPVVWVNVDGPVSAETLSRFGEIFHLHPLALEDVVNAGQRAKVEDYGDNQFFVARMAVAGSRVATEQLSMFLGKDFVLTFQERAGGDCLDNVRARIRKGVGNIRKQGPDHLAYAVIDGVVDGYFPLIEALEGRLEALEEKILEENERQTIRQIREVKRELLMLRHTLRPFRDAVNFMWRDASPLVGQEARVYLRDCADHLMRMLDQIETDRELCADAMNEYLTTASNRMNEVMKVLTMITSLFIPPALIAGIYGMNFKNMPELDWPLGYPLAMGLMLLLVGGLIGFLHWKGWLRDIFKRPSR